LVALGDKERFYFGQRWGIREQMSVAFVILLRQTAAEPAQADVTLRGQVGFAKGRAVVLYGEPVLAQETLTSTKPASTGWSFRKFQTCSVSLGSTGEPLLDVAQNPLHRPARPLGRCRAFAVQNRPFGTQALHAKFERDVQQLPKRGPQ
jgi:hypothetical protein